MKNLIFIFMLASLICRGQSFRDQQMKAPRVKAAYADKFSSMKTALNKAGIGTEGFQMYIRVFKLDSTLEVWLKPQKASEFRLFRSYDICALSGSAGPKRHQGDGQVPEGFYSISAFNPYSSYHLSLGVSYPNSSDRIIGQKNLGGDIMIHGNCVTIGCMPLTDPIIEEVYILAVEARNGGQKDIPVHIFPVRMDEKGLAILNSLSAGSAAMKFWANLQPGYDYFEKERKIPRITVAKDGSYVLGTR